MICPNCQTTQPDDSRFCEECGQALSAHTPPAGFLLDPESLYYFQENDVTDPATGQTVCWVTWFNPETGEYSQESHPVDGPSPMPPTGDYPPTQSPMGGYPPTPTPSPMGDYPPTQPPMGGYPPTQSPMGGYPPTQSPTGGYPPPQPPAGGYPPTQPPTGGYSPTQPPAGGYPPTQPPTGGYPPTQPPAGGCPSTQPPMGGYPPTPMSPQMGGYPPTPAPTPPMGGPSPTPPPSEQGKKGAFNKLLIILPIVIVLLGGGVFAGIKLGWFSPSEQTEEADAATEATEAPDDLAAADIESPSPGPDTADSPSPIPLPTPQAPGTPYRSTAVGFSMDLPDGWYAEENTSPAGYPQVFVTTPKNDLILVQNLTGSGNYPMYSSGSMDESIAENMGQDTGGDSSQLDRSENFKLAGYDCHLAGVSVTLEGTPLEYLYCYALDGGRVEDSGIGMLYNIIYFAPQALTEEEYQEFLDAFSTFVTFPQDPPSVDIEGTHYENSSMGFSLTLPQEWTPVEADAGGNPAIMIQPTLESVILVMSVPGMPGGLGVEFLMENEDELIQSAFQNDPNWEGYTIDRSEKVKLADYDFYLLECNLTASSAPVNYAYLYMTIHSNKLYFIMYALPSTSNEAEHQEFLRVFSTFRMQ